MTLDRAISQSNANNQEQTCVIFGSLAGKRQKRDEAAPRGAASLFRWARVSRCA